MTDKTIEDEFYASWDDMEPFFLRHSSHPYYEWLKPILRLIAELRQLGYDRKFRAGQSMHIFVLSRSREHGLRLEQAYLRIEILYQGGMKLRYREGDLTTEIKLDTIEINAELENLLNRLLAQPID